VPPLVLLVESLPDARPLQDALTVRGVQVSVAVAAQQRIDLAVRRVDADLVVNLVDESAPHGVRAFVTEYLAYLADTVTPVVNGLDAFVIGSSRARQLALLGHLGIRHPPARVVADHTGVTPALHELGLELAAAEVHTGPPVVVQHRPDVGEVARLAFVGGRFVAATVASGEVVAVDPALARLAEEAVRTGGIELGGLSFGIDPVTGTPTCVGVDTGLGPSTVRGQPVVLDPAVDYILHRSGRLSAPPAPTPPSDAR
jgi:hypothetical protein